VRIAHVSDFYLPRLGGIETHIADVAELQRRQGHDVRILTSTPGPATPGVCRVTSDFDHPHAHLPLAVWAGIRSLRELDVDVVHAHLGVASPFAFFMARAAARDGIPTLVTVHSMWAGVAPIMATMDALGRWSTLPIVWTAVSQAAAAPVQRLLPRDTRIGILPNGIHQEQWRLPAAPERPGELHLVSVMRLARRKRPLALLRIVRRAQRVLEQSGDGTRLHLWVAGDGPRQKAIHRVLGAAQVFLAPADLESFGIAALEARCAGLPVVAKRRGGVGEFVGHEREGLLCGSDEEMTDAIVRLARDPALRRRMAEHNRTTECSMAWGTLLESMRSAYTSARAAQAASALSPSRWTPEQQPS